MVDVKKDIDDMLGSFLQEGRETPPEETPPEETPPEETPPAETPPEEKPPEEKPPEEKPPEEKPPEEKPSEETPPAETPPEETPPEEPTVEEQLVAEKARTEKLLKHIEKISGEPAPAAVPSETKPPEETPPPKETPPAVAPTEIKVEAVNFLEGKTAEELSVILDSPEKFNELLNTVYRKGIETSIPLAQERTMLNVPQVTASYIKRYNTIKALVDDFYRENEDLAVVKRSVGMIANEVHAEHPDWKVQDIFNEAAKRTRDALGLTKPAAKPAAPAAPAAPGDPAFAQPRSSRQRGPAKKLTGMQKEIDDLID